MKRILDQIFAHKPLLAILAALYSSLALGFSPILVRFSEVGPFATAFYRFFLSFPILIAWMILDNIKDPQPRLPHTGNDYLLILGAGAFLAVDLSFWYLSMLHTTVVNSTLLNNLTILLVPLFAWIFLKEKPTLQLMIGIILVLCGSAVLVGYSFSYQSQNLPGDLYGGISAIFYSAFMLTVKKLRTSFRTPTILAWGAIPTIYILALGGFANGDNFVPATPLGWVWLMGLALIVHVMGQGLLTYAMAHLSASVSVLILSLSPVFAAFFAWMIAGESLTILQASGAAVVMAGIMIARETGFFTRLRLRKKE